MKMPYAVLVSVIVGVTNVIPFFGPFIGAVPGFIIIVLANPLQGLYFLIVIFILQQVDGNIIGPTILGDATTEIFKGLVRKVSGGSGIDFDKVTHILLMLSLIHI